jgi:hypothetical protein
MIDVPFWYVVYKFVLKFIRMTLWPIDLETCRENLMLFDDIMGCLGIRYWLSEGTALGAVRDGAFIPWDDGVDVGMYNSEKERFVQHGIPELARNGFTW